MSTVLFITDSLAIWICLVQGKAVNVHVETIRSDNGAYKPCSWLSNDNVNNGRHTLVTLVLDSDLSEIEAYPLKVAGSALRHRSNTKALCDQLVHKYPEAIVSTASKTANLHTVLVQQLQLTPNHRQWLARVESVGVVFRSVVTTPEILAALFSFSSGAYIVVSHLLGSCKHVYCQAGCALFVRCFDRIESDQIVPDLKETLVHLHSNELIDGPINAYTIGMSIKASKSLTQLHNIRDVKCFESLREFDDSVVSDSNHDQYHSVIQIAKRADLDFAKPSSNVRRSATAQLQQYRDLASRKRRRISATALVAICVVSIGSSVFVLRERYQEDAATVQRGVLLHRSISELSDELSSLSPAGDAWAKALLSALSIREDIALGPGVVLATLGQVLSQHEQLMLDELSWVSFDDDEDLLTATLVDSALEQASSRTMTPNPSTKPSILLVRLTGRSVSAGGLRAQQEDVVALVNELRRHPEVSFIDVVESPLQLSTEFQSVSTDKRESVFQLHFRMRGRVNSDA